MLSGNLELFALSDVLRFVARSGATGTVNIYRPMDGGRVLLVDGEIAGAMIDGHEPADADGVVDSGVRLLDRSDGEFAFELEPVEGPVRESVEEFLVAVGRRRAEWNKIISAVGSLDEPLILAASLPAGATEITLSPLEWQIAVQADGHRSLRDIAAEAGTSDFETAAALLAMANAGLLSLSGTAEETAHETDGDDPYEAIPFVASEDDQDAIDPDPTELLRELGERRPPPRGRRNLAPARHSSQTLHTRPR